MALFTSSSSAPASKTTQKSASDQISDADDKYCSLLSDVSFIEKPYHDIHMRIHHLDVKLEGQRGQTAQCRWKLLWTLLRAERRDLAVHTARKREEWTEGVKELKHLKDKVSARGPG